MNNKNINSTVGLHMKVIDKQVELYQLANRLHVLLKAILRADKHDQAILYSIAQDYLKLHLPKED